ncbi:chorion transcription factor Cf2-like isoform X2 [Boleophthalmus pectinirostris]|uniref:chorion transcription factor Cf2-like isoform X2 n=1 Tax=Boleophthalmus pectinirostris TaxID=150288 RepID=UPI0024332838|nr:chorion transcription factor Cf2-like isoform X2 [Boleophthalmus pectinirostris]
MSGIGRSLLTTGGNTAANRRAEPCPDTTDMAHVCEHMSTDWRAFVEERLSGEAEGIFVLLKTTIVNLEEELRRSKHENQRLQRLLNSALKALSPRVVLVRAAVQLPSLSTGLIPHIKGEQEEDQLQVSVPECSTVSVKTEESSLLQQRQTQQREDIRAETHIHREDVHSETEGDKERPCDTNSDEDWRAPLSCSPAHMDTGADGDHHNQVQKRARSTTAQNSRLSPKYKSAPETRATVSNGDMSGSGEGAESRTYKCSVLKERFESKYKLQKHRRVYIGEKPFSCSVCKKTFTRKDNLKPHMTTHTGEKPFSCSVCKKTFARKAYLETHMRTHTGEKSFGCSVCKKTFARKMTLETHMRTHTGEKPFTCPSL